MSGCNQCHSRLLHIAPRNTGREARPWEAAANQQTVTRSLIDEIETEPLTRGGRRRPLKGTAPSTPSTSDAYLTTTYKRARWEAENTTPNTEKDPYHWVRGESTRESTREELKVENSRQGI
ncbi:hypothetical protein E2C01_101875 [Portunus trituberculatus]|uniref:Uncharacterized protein n=1 Tax=Portunus trituberculatus TaxID=210409 RepID=A0A5B7KFX7_PORTR|nr:hypothetical protein [Portunus trituberculatus]